MLELLSVGDAVVVFALAAAERCFGTIVPFFVVATGDGKTNTDASAAGGAEEAAECEMEVLEDSDEE